MLKLRLPNLIFCVVILMGAVACGPSLVLQNVDYSQPVESVLSPDSDQMINDQRYAVKFSIAPLLDEEQLSGVNEIRMIRNRAGFYYVTAPGFHNVYIFSPGESVLELVEKVNVSQSGLSQPAFNQRGSYIELIDRGTGDTFNLD